jgi:3,4-dihydroxy 2-butanone 4-phosphate synthase/GTP cyclohydrolase II
MELIDEKGEGVVLYLRQEGRGIGLLNKLKAYTLQEHGADTVEANVELGFDPDMRDYAVAAQIIKALEIKSVKIMTNNPEKVKGLEEYGVVVTGREPIEIGCNSINRKYMKTKKDKMGHLLHFN